MKKIVLFLTVAVLSATTLLVSAAAKTKIYSMAEILELVTKNYAGEVIKIDLESDSKNNVYYEVEIVSNSKKTELLIDAKTGKVTSVFDETLDSEDQYIADNFTQNNNTGTVPKSTAKPTQGTAIPASDKTTVAITIEQAKKIALDKVGGGEIVKCKLDYDHNKAEYEIEIIYGDYEYEMDVDANTGAISDYEEDHRHD